MVSMILQKLEVQIASILKWTVAIKETLFELGVLLGLSAIVSFELLHATNESFGT